jgi:hypothetical protein
MLMVLAPYETLERKVRDRVRADESHRRVAEVLTEVAVDAIHPARHLGVGRSASPAMLADPIERATQAAVETLIARLEELVETLPRRSVEELASEQQMAELGLEQGRSPRPHSKEVRHANPGQRGIPSRCDIRSRSVDREDSRARRHQG